MSRIKRRSAAIAEANDIQLEGRHEFKFRGRDNLALQISSESTGVADDRSNNLCSVNLQCGPAFQSAEAARKIRTKIAGPR